MKNSPRRWTSRVLVAPAIGAATLIAGFSVPSLAKGAQALNVQISAPFLHDSHRSSIIRVEIENTGDEDISLFLWDTPFAQSAGRLPKSLFDVTDSTGKRLRYIGRSVNVGRLHIEDFAVLHPGERRSGDVDLRPEYDYGNGGVFAVRYSLPLNREPDPSVTSAHVYEAFHRNTLDEATSNEAVILINSPILHSTNAPADNSNSSG